MCKSGCACSKNCLSQFSRRPMQLLNDAWHTLSTETQTQVLSQLFNPDAEYMTVHSEGADAVKRRKWQLDGCDVCFRVLQTSWHVCKDNLANDPWGGGCTEGAMPCQPILQKSVRAHFMEMYLSTAEALPEVEAMPDNVDDKAPGLQFKRSSRWNLEAGVPTRITLLLDKTQEVPLRHLPPGRLIELWWQFLSWSESQRLAGAEFEVPSWSTVYRCWIDLFHKRALVFRRKSQHHECDECFKLRELLAGGTLRGEDPSRIPAAGASHKTVYGSIHVYASRARLNALTIIADSMDKAKWSYPKYTYGRAPHELEGFVRPRMAPCLHG